MGGGEGRVVAEVGEGVDEDLAEDGALVREGGVLGKGLRVAGWRVEGLEDGEEEGDAARRDEGGLDGGVREVL